jgi:16S rRNA (guanine527-N7)-methyltransferase
MSHYFFAGREWSDLIQCFVHKNSQLNLSAVRDEQWIFVKHIQDSLEAITLWCFVSGERWCDIGTWWGFPLMPLSLYYWDVDFFWLDARKKKVDAVNDMLRQLWFKCDCVIWSRVEQHKQQYDGVMARAVAHVDILIPWLYPLVKEWGKILLYKQYSVDEDNALKTICRRMKLTLLQQHNYWLFNWDIKRVLYLIKKW